MAPDLLRLSCRNFRSYRALFLDFSSKFVVFFGENGAGKTNILEAISLFSSGRGLRKALLSDLNTTSTAAFSWKLELTVSKNEYKTFLATYPQNSRRVASVDNSSAISPSKFDEILWILWIIPSMDNLFIDAMSERRSFFDHLVSGYDRAHKNRLKKIASLQKERLHVIFFRKDETWLEILEQKIAEESIEIMKTRKEFIQMLHESYREYTSDFLRPFVEVSGFLEQIFETNDEENAALEIANLLKNNRFSDSEKQITSYSVLRSIWEAYHPISKLKAENCSTGEQKAFIISLILSVARMQKNMKSGIPVLLLDDLMVHLDKNRRAHLIQELISLDIQTFFTGTEAYLFDDLKDIAQFYRVEKSICTEINSNV